MRPAITFFNIQLSNSRERKTERVSCEIIAGTRFLLLLFDLKTLSVV